MDDASLISNRPPAGGASLLGAPSGERVTNHSGKRQTPELLDLLLACRHRLAPTILLGTVGAFLLAGLAWFCTSASYEATSLIQVRQHQDVVFSRQTSRSEDLAFVHAQEQLAVAPQTLSLTLADERLQAFSLLMPMHSTDRWLKSLVRTDMQIGSEVLSLSVSHADRHLAHALCNALTAAYVEVVNQRLTSDQHRRESELETAALEADRRLDVLWDELHSVAKTVGADSSQSLTLRDEIQLQGYRDYAQQLRAAQRRGNELQSLLMERQGMLDEQGGTLELEARALLYQQPLYIAAQQRLQDIEAQLHSIRGVAANENSPRLQQLIQEQVHHQAQLDTLTHDLLPQLQSQIQSQKRAELEASLAQLQKQIELNKTEKEDLQALLAQVYSSEEVTTGSGGVQLEMARHAVERQTRLADELWQTLQELRIERQSRPRVQLLSTAEVPTHAYHGRQLKTSGVAGVTGLMMIVFCVGFVEWSGRRLRLPADLQAMVNEPVFGAFAMDESGPRSIGQNKSMSASGAREVAAQLLLQRKPHQPLPSLLVSSSCATEPRAQVALDVAIAMETFHCRTLLIDADIGDDCLSRLLGAQAFMGLFQMGPDAFLEDFTVATERSRLDFLPLGHRDSTVRSLNPHHFQQVLTAARQHYDAIIVCGPAVLSTPESLLMAGHIDRLLFSAVLGSSRLDLLAAARQAAIQNRLTIEGFLLHSGLATEPLTLSRTRPPESSREATEDQLAEGVRAEIADIQSLTQPRSVVSPDRRHANT